VTVPRTFNFADIWEMASDAVPERTALVCGDARRTYAQLEDRANRLAAHLADNGVGAGDHVALYLDNCPEYVEAMLAAFKLRAVPINVNYRYVADELRYLLDDSGAVAVIHPPAFADTLAAVQADGERLTLQTGADYEAALAAASGERRLIERSGDDHYIIYTGGTTGMPKGVVWRQEDAFYACIGGGDPMRLSGPATTPSELPDRILTGEFCGLPLAPLMHAAAQWTTLSWLFCGAKVVLLPGSFDPRAAWRAVETERANLLIMVGDAVGRPLMDAWDEAGGYDVSSLFSLSNGGAPMSPGLKSRLARAFPDKLLVDGFGSSETGAQGSARQSAEEAERAGGVVRFTSFGTTMVIDDDDNEIEPGSETVGRVIARGRLPLGYHNDPEKTAATFVQLHGDRWVITGDMATVTADGTISLLGRGSGCINTGGEKVFPEEVEAVLKAHPSVYDAVVVGVPDERWGSAVAAVVQPHGDAPSLDDLRAHCRASLASYKLPKRLVVVDRVKRSPAGKADYPWARAVAEAD
jgi:acyl-CoA synthetase (AMP-forming)/AMP-acid ligase II